MEVLKNQQTNDYIVYEADKYRFEIPPFDESLYYFDKNAAYRVCWFFENRLRHVKGALKGRKFKLEQWQINFLSQLYGMKRLIDGLRRYSTAFLAIPRKNGKSTLSAGIALYGLYGDGEKGAEVYSAAGDKEQAKIIFDIAKAMVQMEPELSVLSDPQKDIIKMRTMPGAEEIDTSFYKVVSSEAYSKHGLNPSTIVFDEFHTQPNRELYDVYTTATGSREQPIIVFITTAGDDKLSICKEKWDECLKIKRWNEARARGEQFDEMTMIEDDTVLVCIYAADEKDDWHDQEVWKKANPSLGTALKTNYFLKKYAEAIRSSADAKAFKQLHLNMWVDSYTAWIDQEKWLECYEDFKEQDLKGFEFVAGIDCSAVKDLTALMLVFKKGELFYIVPYFFMPSDTIKERAKEDRVPYDKWVEQGYIYPIEGSANDQEALLLRYSEILNGLKGKELVFDAWGVPFIIKKLSDAGYNVNLFRQTLQNYTAPTKFVESCILNKRIRHNNNPVLNWMMSIVEVYQSGNGDIKPMKPKGQNKAESKRIDGVVALIMAMSKHIAAVETKRPSPYEQPGRLNSW